MHLNKIKKELGLTDAQFKALNEVIKQLVFEQRSMDLMSSQGKLSARSNFTAKGPYDKTLAKDSVLSNLGNQVLEEDERDHNEDPETLG